MNKWKQQQKQSWTRPSLILLVCLIAIILILPSLIVIPYSQPKQAAQQVQTTTSGPTAEEQPASIQETDSPLVISVYRTKQQNIEKVPLEEYVAGVVAAEMPSSFETEALKAQALAARTYLVRQMNSEVKKQENADITDNINSHQAYKNKDELAKQWKEGYTSNLAKIQHAVNATKGEILTYDGEPIDPLFFSTSNGYTENSEDYWTASLPYLRSVPSPWDKESPEYIGTKKFSSKEFRTKLGTNLTSDIRVKRTATNRVSSITINEKEFSGDEFKRILDLRSTDFSFQIAGDTIQFTTIGYGHGVGMSQYGANSLAKEGKSYQDIVKYYYKGIEIDRLEAFTELVMED